MSRRRKVLSLDVPDVPVNFLLTCSDRTLSDYELKTLADIADTRNALLEVLDKLADQMGLAGVVRWFRTQDREELKRALDNPDDVIALAKEQIRDGQRSAEELIPRAALVPGAAHLAASLRYQKRNIAEGKCRYCPKPLDRNSVDMCTDHLAKARARSGPKGKPGSADYLYGDGFQDRHGRQPGTLASLEMNREKKTRAVLAELGIPPEFAAVSLKAAKDALWRVMPQSKASAKPMADLFEAAVVPSRTTGQKALRELLSEGKIQRIGEGTKADLFLYFEKRGEK